MLQGLHSRLVHLGVEQGDRLKELSTANTRLGAWPRRTTDSHKVLTELLAAWPDDDSDAIARSFSRRRRIRDALGELNEHARANLKAGVQHAAIGVEVRGHLSALEGRLTAAQAEQPLTKDWISSLEQEGAGADQAAHRAAATPHADTPAAAPATDRGAAERAPRGSAKVRVDPSDPDAISSFLAQARSALSEQGGKSINVVLTREEDAE